MLSNHPNVETPDADTVIWRYIDLERFISLLHTRALFLCRLDAFRDPWEGSWPRPLIDATRSSWEGEQGDHFLNISSRLRTSHFVSCWHASQSESAALWDLYAGKSGVAIKSTVGSLLSAISDEKTYYLGKVRYIDFEYEQIEQLNILIPPFLKRKSFEHEREVRLLYWEVPFKESIVDPSAAAVSQSISVDPNVLVEQLYIAPSSPPWLADALKEVCRKFELAASVRRSSLYDPRVY